MDINVDSFIREALAEDIGNGDHTSLATTPEGLQGTASLLIKDNGILCGVALAERIFHLIDPTVKLESFIADGSRIENGQTAFHVHGSIRSILMAERLVLNFMQRMSGVSSLTRRYVDAVNGTKARIMDTRKTTPLLRVFEKYAVRCGGGHNHRFGLFDMILIKDNHIDACGGVAKALRAAQSYLETNDLQLPIEVETRTLSDIEEALSTGIPQRIMFDNFSPELTKAAVELVNGKVECESSGGITLQTVHSYAITGVDCISVGALTHSAGSLDLSLKILK
ncbi:MAG: carboxylating nicotinate-nucleotide diphosphorylase [Bacteroidota bacterium]|jgi:nicotinate-nucleotide pyrophosphorylase (carboxylating)